MLFTWRENANCRRDELNAAIFQLEILNQLRRKRTGTAGEQRTFETRMDFFSDAGTADLLASFEDDRFKPGPREIVSRNQAIMSGANDDDVLECHVLLDCGDLSPL